MAAEVASLDDLLLGQQPGERPHGRGLSGALLTADQYAADGGIDRVQDEGQLHLVLADDRGERVGVAV